MPSHVEGLGYDLVVELALIALQHSEGAEAIGFGCGWIEKFVAQLSKMIFGRRDDAAVHEDFRSFGEIGDGTFKIGEAPVQTRISLNDNWLLRAGGRASARFLRILSLQVGAKVREFGAKGAHLLNLHRAKA